MHTTTGNLKIYLGLMANYSSGRGFEYYGFLTAGIGGKIGYFKPREFGLERILEVYGD